MPAAPARRQRSPIMLRFLIVDDHAVVRRGLRTLLKEAFAEVEVGEAEDAEEALSRLDAAQWDLAVLDVSLPGKGGLELLKTIKSRYPKVSVLMLSALPEAEYAVRALKAGASGYLNKDAPDRELVAAARKALDGGKHISETLAQTLADALHTPEHMDQPHLRLSDRELEVLRLIAQGQTPTQIAKQLALSVKTVSTYRTRILEKMHMKTNAELMRYAVKNKIAE